MVEKARVEYQVVVGGDKLLREVSIEAKKEITITEYGPADDLIKIGGDIKAIYVHRSNLVSVIIDNASDIQ